MRNRFLLFLLILSGSAWNWFWEFIRSLLYERGSRMMTPSFDSVTMDDLLRWGPTIGFPAVGLWLIWKTRQNKIALQGEAYVTSDKKNKAAADIKLGDKVTAIVIPAPKYNRAQIGHIVEAIDAFYPILLEVDNALVFGSGIAASMEAIIRDNGADVYLSRMDGLRLKLNDALGRLQKAKEQYGLYQEACKIVADSNLYSDQFYASLNDLAGILREIPDKLNASSLTIFVGAKKETFITKVTQFHEWTKQQKQALVISRQSYLQHPATD